MTRYLVLEAPGGPDRDHRSTRFVADRFHAVALFLPWIWLAAHRLWLRALAVFVVQMAAGVLALQPGFEIAGTLATLATGLLTALEGGNAIASHLVARGWRLRTVIHAHDLETAEAMWFGSIASHQAEKPPERVKWVDMPAQSGNARWRDETSGLTGLDFSGGR